MIIWMSRPFANDHPNGLAFCKWSYRWAILLQMIIRIFSSFQPDSSPILQTCRSLLNLMAYKFTSGVKGDNGYQSFFCGVTNFCQHISLNFLQHKRPFEDILTRCFVFHPSDFPEEVLKAPPDTAAATRWWSSDVNGSLLSPSFPEVITLKKPGVKLLELPFFCPYCFPLKKLCVKLPKLSLHFIVYVYFMQLKKI